LDKESHTVAHAFDHSWFCHGNQIHQNWVSRTPSILWNKGSDCKYHQPTDQCNPQMHTPSYCKPTPIPSLDVHQTQLIGWHSTWAPCTCTVGNEQYLPHHSSGNIHSTCLSPWHGYAESLTYSVGNLVLIRQDTNGKLAKPTHGPYQLIDVVHQHVNGTVIVELNHSHKIFNIQWLIPFKPCQNHWRHNLLYHVPHHIIFLFGNYDSHIWVITMLTNPLRKPIHFLHQYTSPFATFATLPSVLFYKERLYISTQHSAKPWRGSLYTSLPHHHLVRVEIITSILAPIVSILL
jgi:hypothetical protein